MQPLVTVIIPTYNRTAVLSAAVESAQRQTLHDIEILVCDDGSTDGSKSLVEKIQADDPRVLWIPGAHSGLPAVPRNKGFSNAKGEWIAMLDSDDKWFPMKLEEQLQSLSKTGFKACCTNALRRVKNADTTTQYQHYDKDRIDFTELCRTVPIVTSSVVFHKELLETIGGFPETEYLRGVEDFALWLRVASQTTFAYVPTPLLEYTDEAADSVRGRRMASIPVLLVAIWRDFLNWAREHRGMVARNDYRRALSCYRMRMFHMRMIWMRKIITRLTLRFARPEENR